MIAGAGGAAFGLSLPAMAQFPADLPPPPVGKDAYGLDAILGRSDGFDRLLRELGEPAILTADAAITGATFRLSENYSLQRPRAARIIFFQDLEPKAVSIVKSYGTQTARDAKPLTYLRYFDGADATRLRLLIDDQERFWDALPIPVDWTAIDCQAHNGNKPCIPAPPEHGGASLLEGRIGTKRHAILRKNPHRTSLVRQLTHEIF
jgi:hypothetical protein